MTVSNVRTGKDVRLTRAMKHFFASERESVDVAFAGDVVGLANPGVFAIGDTLTDGGAVRFDPIPAFEPEHFSLVRSTDTASYKSFQKGIAQLREEGAIQVFYPYGQTRIEPILAAVGALQFEVVKYRLESEYNVKTVFQNAALHDRAARYAGEGNACGDARFERAARRRLGRRAARAVRKRVERRPRGGSGIRG